MSNRRKFIQQSGALAAASLLFGRSAMAAAFNKPAQPIGLQLYTLGNLMTTDAKGTLQKLAAIGYTQVESAGSQKGNWYGFKPKEFAALVKETGMTWRSAHVAGAPISVDQILKMAKTAEDSAKIQKMMAGMKNMPKQLNLKDDHKQLADEAAEGGINYLMCSFIPVGTMDEMKTAVEVFSKAGEACKKVGVQFGYHNHTTEFDQVEGQRPFDYILSNTDKDLVKWSSTLHGQPRLTRIRSHYLNFIPGASRYGMQRTWIRRKRNLQKSDPASWISSIFLRTPESQA